MDDHHLILRHHLSSGSVIPIPKILISDGDEEPQTQRNAPLGLVTAKLDQNKMNHLEKPDTWLDIVKSKSAGKEEPSSPFTINASEEGTQKEEKVEVKETKESTKPSKLS